MSETPPVEPDGVSSPRDSRVEPSMTSSTGTSSPLDISINPASSPSVATADSSTVDTSALSLSDSDFRCGICNLVIREAFMTRCGHNFCYRCIRSHLQNSSSCPNCNGELTTDQIYPNFILDRCLRDWEMLKKSVTSSPVSHTSPAERTILSGNSSLMEINAMIESLHARKRRLEADERGVELDVLSDFLQRSKSRKVEQYRRLRLEVDIVHADLLLVEMQRRDIRAESQPADSSVAEVPSMPTPALDEDQSEGISTLNERRLRVPSSSGRVSTDVAADVEMKKKGVRSHFTDFEAQYFEAQMRRASGEAMAPLGTLRSLFSRFSRYSQFKVLTSLNSHDLMESSNIISSIEFDRDGELFATAGVSKRIKIFELEAVLANSDRSGSRAEEMDIDEDRMPRPRGISELADVHFPVRELLSQSKLSCLSWNPSVKAHIASSDYDGAVTVWDVGTGQTVVAFREHERRVWSVDYFPADSARIVSGSDDCRVKVWSVNQQKSVATIETRANVCCVRAAPENSHLIAFGSADHHVHFYDLRHTRNPSVIFKGHRKAVSYLRFLNRNDFVSASTDSTLKLWSLQSATANPSMTLSSSSSSSSASVQAPVPPAISAPPPLPPPRSVSPILIPSLPVFTLSASSSAVTASLSASVLSASSASSSVPFNIPNVPAPPLTVVPAGRSSNGPTLRGDCHRTLAGHVNHKHFVGLTASADGEYIMCGSENNGVYMYYRHLSRPMLNLKFGRSHPVTGEEMEDDKDPSLFVSSVCWRKNSNIVLAANSQGNLKVMELI
eukprot:GILJ01012084.1.p1 GENE.GILJ01012084.1~~GILJ01012084.1.p1  ORF type:complete len:785 (-),score=100.78 GILJ01012084.1:150-2504(-)